MDTTQKPPNTFSKAVLLTLCIPRGVVFICPKNEYILQKYLSSSFFTIKPYKTILRKFEITCSQEKNPTISNPNQLSTMFQGISNIF